MSAFILGQKENSSHVYDDKGEYIPVTFIHTSPCYLMDVKWPQKNGYMALKLAFGETKRNAKSVQGELEKAGIKTPLRFLKEFRVDEQAVKPVDENGKTGIEIEGKKLMVGQEIVPADFFKKGDKVRISGTSKGKGFQGVVKRHAFKGGPKTHGQSDRWRGPGSVGMTTTPGRIFRGKRMAGRMGQDRVTVRNIEVVDVQEKGIIVKGTLPGSKKGFLEVVKL